MKKKKRMSRKKRILIKLLIVAVVLAIVATAVVSYFKGNILPVVLTMSEATVKELAVNAINSATHMVLDEKLPYDDFVTITKDNEGKIELLQMNTVKINRLTRDLANLCQANIERIEEQTIKLPIGAFTGSVVLSGVGPNIDIALMPIGSVMCDFVSIFEEVGINQTRHSIYININTSISLVLPVSSVPVNTCTTVLVCDNIIVGDVPNFYVSGGNGNKLLDLLPA